MQSAYCSLQWHSVVIKIQRSCMFDVRLWSTPPTPVMLQQDSHLSNSTQRNKTSYSTSSLPGDIEYPTAVTQLSLLWFSTVVGLCLSRFRQLFWRVWSPISMLCVCLEIAATCRNIGDERALSEFKAHESQRTYVIYQKWLSLIERRLSSTEQQWHKEQRYMLESKAGSQPRV